MNFYSSAYESAKTFSGGKHLIYGGEGLRVAGFPTYDRGLRTSAIRRLAVNSVFNKRASMGKLIMGVTRHPIISGIVMFGASAMMGTGRQLTKSISFSQPQRPSALRSGPGYISWSKTSGMPANHLSTDGLGLALSNARHTSTIG